jgi:hypothetical protein
MKKRLVVEIDYNDEQINAADIVRRINKFRGTQVREHHVYTMIAERS